ncbi:branched-chain amino acid ABC transporter ATP-binding protein/permease [Ferrovibrio sp.]|uniref:branched-chain amino acid ABC transporter ATP-binding protein/permease n=1 Tax=Ferrovibrio sp. TaxID=1917215 RepID=UPI0025C5871F|nr:branched-chain amino acid ABC transporter ATP-binding protein/permease [Ferrovibrio sp.]MBX3453011.1 branched-chain amino acid ABC transporter ATP-binding protein/permease [Ferrovibrio sp.]
MDRRILTAIVAGGIALAVLPWIGLPAFYESFLYLLFHWIILAVSWNILSGYTGYFSFGHGAFFGAGIYGAAYMAGTLGWPFLASLPVAALVAVALGLALGAVVFRVASVRGELFALLTLAITFVIATIILNTRIDGGPGIYMMGVDIPKLGPNQASSIYMMGLILAVISLLVAYMIYVSRFGAGLFAIHDDEDVAEVMGVPTYRFKLYALAVSCALAGLAGGVHSVFVSYITVSEVFSITVPLSVVLMSILGGSRHWFGPAVGAVAITCLLYFFTSGDGAVLGRAIFGGILVVVILFMPNGILGLFSLLKRMKRKPATEHVVPHAAPAPEKAAKIGAPILRVRGLSKSFKGLKALNDVTLEVREGEILGLIGPNGSGKSTFINVVSGHYRNDGGSIEFMGRELSGQEAHFFAQAGIARTYQIPRPFVNKTVLENIAMAGMFGAAALSREAAMHEAHEFADFAGLGDRKDALPDDLNLHQRKFLELARALAARPKLLMLDEVLSGLTPSEINGAIDMVRRIRAQGTTIIFVEHVMRAVMALTDRIVVLNHGVLIAEGLPAEVMSAPEVKTAYLGKAHA